MGEVAFDRRTTAFPKSNAALSTSQADVLAASAKAPPASITVVSLSSGLEAVLAVHGTVPSWLEWQSGLLSARGTDRRCTP